MIIIIIVIAGRRENREASILHIRVGTLIIILL